MPFQHIIMDFYGIHLWKIKPCRISKADIVDESGANVTRILGVVEGELVEVFELCAVADVLLQQGKLVFKLFYAVTAEIKIYEHF
jgi:hypothetical protein